MINRLTAFAGLSLTAIGIGVALIVHDMLAVGNPDMGEVGLVAGLIVVDLVLILLAARNIRWAQYVYAGLFGLGLHFKLKSVFTVMEAAPAEGALYLLALGLHVLAFVALVIEIRAQRAAAKLAGSTEPAQA